MNVVVLCIMGDMITIVRAVCMDMSKVTEDASLPKLRRLRN